MMSFACALVATTGCGKLELGIESDSEVMGSGFSQTGIASYYGVGDGFHGRRTANGETFNAYGLSAAHRTLRFGSCLLVTNLYNGKKGKSSCERSRSVLWRTHFGSQLRRCEGCGDDFFWNSAGKNRRSELLSICGNSIERRSFWVGTHSGHRQYTMQSFFEFNARERKQNRADRAIESW